MKIILTNIQYKRLFTESIEDKLSTNFDRINNEISSISKAEVSDKIRKKSSKPFGRGTTIIAIIAKINAMSTYSFLNSISFIFIYG